MYGEVIKSLVDLGASQSEMDQIENDLKAMFYEAQMNNENIADIISDPFEYAKNIVDNYPRAPLSKRLLEFLGYQLMMLSVLFLAIGIGKSRSIGGVLKYDLFSFLLLALVFVISFLYQFVFPSVLKGKKFNKVFQFVVFIVITVVVTMLLERLNIDGTLIVLPFVETLIGLIVVFFFGYLLKRSNI